MILPILIATLNTTTVVNDLPTKVCFTLQNKVNTLLPNNKITASPVITNKTFTGCDLRGSNINLTKAKTLINNGQITTLRGGYSVTPNANFTIRNTLFVFVN